MTKEASPESSQARLRAMVYGRVQGVNFRSWTRAQAERLGLVGYVRNRGDGAVEVVAQGSRTALDDLMVWLRQGPRLARVNRVEVTSLAPNHEFDCFEVRY
jgi:acylphosphatase